MLLLLPPSGYNVNITTLGNDQQTSRPPLERDLLEDTAWEDFSFPSKSIPISRFGWLPRFCFVLRQVKEVETHSFHRLGSIQPVTGFFRNFHPMRWEYLSFFELSIQCGGNIYPFLEIFIQSGGNIYPVMDRLYVVSSNTHQNIHRKSLQIHPLVYLQIIHPSILISHEGSFKFQFKQTSKYLNNYLRIQAFKYKISKCQDYLIS